MTSFGERLKHLRRTAKLSQEGLSQALELTRSTLSGYENETAEPSIGTLKKIAAYFEVSLDYLMGISNEGEDGKADITGRFLRVLTTTVDSDDNENIELVPVTAKAGYRTGFADPDFIRVLPTFQLPFLSKQKKYRSFQLSGDSMPPIEDGAYVTAEFVENWNNLKDGFPYVVVTREDGIVFKVVYNKMKESESLLLCSTNPIYEPYSVKVKEVAEIWKFVNFMSSEPPTLDSRKDQSGDVSFALQDLKKEVEQLKMKLG